MTTHLKQPGSKTFELFKYTPCANSFKMLQVKFGEVRKEIQSFSFDVKMKRWSY